MTVRSKMIMATTDKQEIKVDILVLWVMLLLWDLHHVCIILED